MKAITSVLIIAALAMGQLAISQTTKPAEEKKEAPGLTIEQTIRYINKKVADLSDKPANIRKIRLLRTGELQETYSDGATITYYAKEIKDVKYEHYSEKKYRVRLTCKTNESSCMRPSDVTKATKPHTDFILISEIEAKRLTKAFQHLLKEIKASPLYNDPFDGEVDTGPKKKRRRGR